MSGYADKASFMNGPSLDRRGFSLTELIVVMGIFLTIMLITSSAFKLIANNTSQQSKSLETQIGGIVGLEALRADLEQAGFGLPWEFRSTPSDYSEALDATYNDAPGDPPRAIISGLNNTLFGSYTGSRYIVIKSSVVAANESSKKWTNVAFAEGVKKITSWGDPHRDFAETEKVIVVKNNLNKTPTTRQLMVANATDSKVLTSGTYYTTFNNYTALTLPHLDGDTFQVYGIASAATTAIRMPFNRADYFISNTPATDIPGYCAPNTGVLYKATINHAGGGINKMALLDCVADMQIVYGLDNDGGGRVNQYLDTPAVDPSLAANIRNQLREIRVYILVQDGKKDRIFSYPNPSVEVGETLFGVFRGRRYPLGDAYKNYRWKVYTIVVRPKNLIQ